MRVLAVLGIVAALALTACGGGSASAAEVVRGWSDAVNADDNETAAGFFSRGATVIQFGEVKLLRTPDDAISWNAGLPCSGEVLELATEGETATVTFRLADRGGRRCDAPGTRASAVIRVRDGKIVLWHQLERPLEPSTDPV